MAKSYFDGEAMSIILNLLPDGEEVGENNNGKQK